MNSTIYLLWLIISLIGTQWVQTKETQMKKQILVEFGDGPQSIQLISLFYDVKYTDGLYVDIGAFDPFAVSNTHYLYLKKWKGIVVQPSPIRLKRFLHERPNQVHLNVAAGSQDVYLTLHDNLDDSMGTVSQNVAADQKSYKSFNKTTKVPSLSLAQICQRYFHKAPLFMNLDTQGFGSAVLLSNNWSNPKCRPDVIISENNRLDKLSKLIPSEQVFKANKYKLLHKQSKMNEVYIRQDVFQKYLEKSKNKTYFLQKYQIVYFRQIANILRKQLNIKTKVYHHYERQLDQVNYYSLPQNTPLNIKQVNQNSNIVSKIKNKLIVVLNFNSQNSYIILNHNNYTISEAKIGVLTFHNLTIFQKQFKLTSLILDNSPKKNPKIFVISNIYPFFEQEQEKAQQSNKNDNQVISNLFKNQISSLKDYLNKKIQPKNVLQQDKKDIQLITSLFKNQISSLKDYLNKTILVKKIQLQQELKKQDDQKTKINIETINILKNELQEYTAYELNQIKFVLISGFIILILYVITSLILQKTKEQKSNTNLFVAQSNC